MDDLRQLGLQLDAGAGDAADAVTREMLASNVDCTDWMLEVEQVLPLLKLTEQSESKVPCITEMLFFTRNTLVWKGIFGCCIFSVRYSGYRYVCDGGTNRREILHDGTRRSWTDLLLFWGRYPQGNPKSEILGLNFGHMTSNISKTISRALHVN